MDVKPKVTEMGPIGETSRIVPGNVPAFLMKLWKIVEDVELDPIISWSQNGQTFKVHDQIAFARDVLPKYYKHSNFSSFVRQVNMYGFRKIIDASSGGLKHEKDEWEFFHPSFQQDQPNLLQQIKRKVSAKESDNKTAQVNSLLGEVEQLKIEHDNVAVKLENVRSENQMLWREVGDLRQQHRDQQAVINKLIQVFIKIVMNNKKDIPRGTKRRALNFPLNENKFPRASNTTLPYNSGQVSQEILPYNPKQLNQFESLPPDTIYSVESPSSPFRLTEILDDPSDNNQISVIEEDPLPALSDINNVSSVTVNPSTSVDNFSALSLQPKTTVTSEPFSVKNGKKIITVVPDKTTVNSETENISSSEGFVFPVKYEEKTSTSKTDAEKTKDCINMEPSQISFECIKALSDPPDDDIITVMPSSPPIETLSTPDSLVPPPPKIVSLRPSNEVLSTPVVPIPNFARQVSFKDREEISENVQKINRSIEHLQDLLDNQAIPNFDVKNLNILSEYLPDNYSVQDITKAIEAAGSDLAITAPENEQDQTDQPMSPSEYMDPSYGMSDAEFLTSVLQNQTSNNPGTSTS